MRKIIGGAFSLSTAGKKGWHCHRHMIVLSAMVKAVDHMKGYVMNPIDVSALLCMIGKGKRYRCMIDWGARPYYVILLEEEYLHMIG